MVSGAVWGDVKTLACVLWTSEGSSFMVFTVSCDKKRSEPSVYKNLPALRPELVLGELL